MSEKRTETTTNTTITVTEKVEKSPQEKVWDTRRINKINQLREANEKLREKNKDLRKENKDLKKSIG